MAPHLNLPRIERRSVDFDDYDVREEGGELRFDGIAAVTGRWTELFDGMYERIDKGAFRKLLRGKPDVRLLVDHDPSKVLARSTIADGPGSLRLTEEPRGLRTQAVFSATTLARDTATLVRDKVVDQMSFAWPYGATRDTVEEVARGIERTIHEFTDLRDASIVTFPAYKQTTAAMRSLECGIDLSEEELRRVATDVHEGRAFADEHERRLIDEAFARIDSLSPWMEELARRALGVAAARTADQEPEDNEPDATTVGGSAAARERRLAIRTRVLQGVN